ncbi:MAG: hypothetical protein WCK57_00595 [Verrucomicrobiae bacterium]
MKATKQSFSIPGEMNEWLEQEMKKTRRSRSSLVQEGLELLREKKGRSAARSARDAGSGNAPSTGSTRGADFIAIQAKSGLIAEDPASTPSALFSVRSRK